MYPAMEKFRTRYVFSTTTSHARRDWGKFRIPIFGIRCQNRSGRPRSTVTNSRHITIAETATSSPRIAISLIGFHWETYAGMMSRTAEGAPPTIKGELGMEKPPDTL